MNKIFKMRRLNSIAIIRLRRKLRLTFTKAIYYHFESMDKLSKRLGELSKDIPVNYTSEYTWDIMSEADVQRTI